MITFILSLAALVLGYIFYGRFVERVFGPDDRVTPAVSKAAVYLKQQLDKVGYPAWVNEYSNTVFMRCPSPELAHKYQLAQNEDPRFGGKLAHVVVMQHFTEESIDAFVAALI